MIDPVDIVASTLANGNWQGDLKLQNEQEQCLACRLYAEAIDLDESGQLVMLSFQDTSREAEILKALQDYQRLHNRSQQLSKIGHWDIDVKTMKLTGTDELFEIFGLPKGASFMAFDEVVHPDDREGAIKIIENTINNGGRYDSTYRIVTHDNTLKWVHAIGESVIAEDGTLVEISGSVQEISSLKAVEEELYRMQKLKSLGVLAGGIAHDFNNIHTMVFGNISLALNNMADSQPGYRDLRQAEKAIHRASNLSNQLLTFAKGGNPVKTPLQLDVLIKNLVSMDLAGSNIKPELRLPGEGCVVDADRGQMKQVFSNLVINAIQAMPNGGYLYINVDSVEFPAPRWNLDSGKYVHVQIRDEGRGISEENIDLIFDPYFSTKATGNGLGLATVYSIINRHGGRINVNSQIGRGTTFDIYLPAGSDSLPEDTETDDAVSATGGRSGRILVMDDEPLLCELACKILEKEGFEVDITLSGSDVVKKYQQAIVVNRPYACVIMDLTIPGELGGKETVQEILRLHPEARAIVSSGYAVDPVMANYRDYGFKGVMPKPYNPTTMVKIVCEVLKAS